MKVIFTNWSQATPMHGTPVPEMAAVANYFAQKHGYETVLFGDELSLRAFHSVKFNDKVRLPDEILNKFPKSAWSIAKLLSVSYIREPFIHIDFDFFMKKNIEEKFKTSDAFFFHQEIWMDKTFAESEFIINKKPKELQLDYNKRSYNCSIFGGVKHENFSKACKIICDFAIENSHYLEQLNLQQSSLKNKNLVPNFLYLTMLLEQVWMPRLLINDGAKVETILTNDIIAEFEKTNYSEDFNPQDFTQENQNLNHKNIFSQYYNLLNNEATNKSLVHLYGKNTVPLMGMLQILINKFNISY